MTTDSNAFIVAEGLTIGVEHRPPIIKSIDLHLTHQRIALVGESGSGKSMTARALMGLLPRSLSLQARRFTLGGDNLLNLKEGQWNTWRGTRIGMVLQDPKYALNPARSIGWQVEEPLKLHQKLSRRARREKVLEMMNAVGLSDPAKLIDDYPHQLSGGMGQRVMLAMALINDPHYLIADEPTSALDQQLRDQVLDLIVRLTEQRKMGLLLISHDLQQVAAHCQQVFVMYQGQILDRLPASALASASHPYTRTLWACRPNKSLRNQPLPTLDRVALEASLEHD